MATKRIVLVTGANTGLGYQIVRALSGSDRSYEILLGGRSIEKARKAADDARTEFPDSQSRIHPVQIDIEDDASIATLFEKVEEDFSKLDVLINNAGTLLDQEYAAGTLTMREVWAKTWDVNVASTQVMTHHFIPLLLKSDDPRIAFMASGTSSLVNSEGTLSPANVAPPKGWPKQPGLSLPAYRSSKSGMNMMMREWYRVLKEDGVKVWAISPGFLVTGLGGNPGALKAMGAADPSIGGQFVKEVVEGSRDEDVGKVVSKAGVQPW